MTRVAVFVDYQNTYMRARRAFGSPASDHFTFGQVHPERLGLILADRGRAVDAARRLNQVRCYRGQPDARRDPRARATFQRQAAAWRAQRSVFAISRPLQYLPVGGNTSPKRWVAREKGIDVLIAVDMVMGAVNDEYDVAVLVSADTDLEPALEAVLAMGKPVEVASWSPDTGYGSRLSVRRRNVWCHWLNRGDFNWVSDPTDYTKQSSGSA